MEKNAIQQRTQNQVAPTLAEKFLGQVIAYAATSGEQLDQKTKTLAVDIITGVNKIVKSNQYTWGELDINGCGLVSQIKRFAKIGLSMEDKLYIDIRHNSKTGLKDIYIKPQYQCLEKLMVKFFTKPILRFKEDVICEGDELVEEEDFYTGLSKIVAHNRNKDIDRNKFENIIGAYKIAYIQDGKDIVQYVVKIDKNRIDRAYNASPSREKTVWKADTRKMVLKTATWEMWNDKNIRAFIVFPTDIVNDLSILEESQEMNWNNDMKHNNVNQVQDEVKENVASSDIIDMEYEEEQC